MNLVEVTESAIEQFKLVYSTRESTGKEERIRIACKGGGCSGATVTLDFTSLPPDPENDLLFDRGGFHFVIDVKSAVFLDGATLDYTGGSLDKKFTWDIPNATGPGCGCGASFSF